MKHQLNLKICIWNGINIRNLLNVYTFLLAPLSCRSGNNASCCLHLSGNLVVLKLCWGRVNIEQVNAVTYPSSHLAFTSAAFLANMNHKDRA